MYLNTKREIVSEVVCLRNLCKKDEFDECCKRVDKDIGINDTVPDFWYVKSIAEHSNVNVRNYCLLKAKELRRDGYDPVVFTDDELTNGNFDIDGIDVIDSDRKFF